VFTTEAVTVTYPYDVLTMKMEIGGRTVDTVEYMPVFWIAYWEGRVDQPVIINIDFRTPWVRSGIKDSDGESGRSRARDDNEQDDSDDDYDDYDDSDSGSPEDLVPSFGGGDEE